MKRILSVLLALALMVSATACGGSSSSSGSAGSSSAAAVDVNKTDLVIATASEAVTLDPQAGWDGNSLNVMRQMYNGLVKMDGDMNIVGDLAGTTIVASSLDSLDKKVYRA